MYTLTKTNKKSFDIDNIEEYSFNMPRESDKNLSKTEYSDILEKIQQKFSDMKDNILPEKLGIIFEETCSYIPSNSLAEYSDISYYDHVKIMSALSACMYIYDKENDITDFKEEYFSNPQKSRNTENFYSYQVNLQEYKTSYIQ